ncbi:sugar fermentation stimulation protein A [Paenibacillus sp. RC254]|uniref:DNA/RNA nuclease SfsA n=1 Tax=unclassified Paenibacillus TaxID=185978 RepID=UPI0024B91CB3|nr:MULTISPECIES: DNA/RNA nuclease SfsA [unclassified Paenibacillus]
MKNNNPFIFEPPLQEGIIRKRRNRFIMEVEINGIIYDCHCPTTGRIGNIVIRDIACLLSHSTDLKRKTPYTVEAISLDHLNSEQKNWIGINQNAANRYVEHYIVTDQLSDMVKNGTTLKREQKLGNSKLDFLVNNTYIEVKTPLQQLQIEIPAHITEQKGSDFNSHERFIKHISELAGSLEANERAILLTCLVYNNQGFRPAMKNKNSHYIKESIYASIQQGIEIWQINFKITSTGVDLVNYYEMTENFTG